MLHPTAGALRFKVRGLQLKVPFGGAVGVIDQHEMGIVLQAFGLELHGAAVLLDEFGEDEFQQFWTEGQPAKKIPGGNDIDTALVARDGRDGGERGKPVLPCTDGFAAQVGEGEIDGRGNGIGGGIKAQ